MSDRVSTVHAKRFPPRTEQERLEAIGYFVAHAQNYAQSDRPVPGWVWDRIREAADGL